MNAPPVNERGLPRLESGKAPKFETAVVARPLDTPRRHSPQAWKLPTITALGNPTVAPVASVLGKIEAEADSFNAACRRVMAHAATEGRAA